MAYQVSSVNISFTANANKMTTALNKLNTSLNNVNKTARETRGAFSSLSGIFGSLTKQGTASAFNGLSHAFSSLAKVGLTAVGFKTFSSFVSDSIDMAKNYTETLNKMSVALNNDSEALERVTNLAQRYEDILGINKGEFLDYQAGFASMARGYGVANKDIEIMSQNLTQLAYDYSSLYNKDVSEAFTKINSAMAGQSKGLKAYGNVVDNAALKEKARELGLSTQISSLGKATQAYLRYTVIMENASQTGVFGDQSRTLGTLANQMRILEARVKTLKRSFGDIFGVIIRALVGPLSTAVAYVNYLVTSLKNLLGIKAEGLDFVATGDGIDLGDFADDTEEASNNLSTASANAKELKKHLQGFDELHLIPKQEESSSGSSSGGIADMGGWDFDLFNIYDFLAGRMEGELADTFTNINEAIKDGLSASAVVLGTFGSLKILQKAYGPIVDMLSKIIE